MSDLTASADIAVHHLAFDSVLLLNDGCMVVNFVAPPHLRLSLFFETVADALEQLTKACEAVRSLP